MNNIVCPECKNEIEISDDVKVGDVVECPYCGVELEITEINGEDCNFIMLEEEK